MCEKKIAKISSKKSKKLNFEKIAIKNSKWDSNLLQIVVAWVASFFLSNYILIIKIVCVSGVSVSPYNSRSPWLILMKLSTRNLHSLGMSKTRKKIREKKKLFHDFFFPKYFELIILIV